MGHTIKLEELFAKVGCTIKSEELFASSVADPRSGVFLTPGSGIRMGKKSGPGMRIRNEQPGSNLRA
jgi:hypothetical protein